MRHGIWPALMLALAVAACGETPAEAPAAEAGALTGVTVTQGRLSLPPVKGNPAAVYFEIANAGDKDLMIRAATVEGAASTQLHQMGTWNLQPSMDQLMQVPVPKGQTVKFAPGGLHVMVYELSDTLAAGGTTQVTLNLVGGETVTFPVEIRAAGDER
ncbi:MAG: hypothetical protein B7Z08_05600 [Sphingomonadales bacterium 32-68-7]|nr:MAG: hypothetical protein B7Z33_03675 [Sphingomonadales bacterium 12-68-11]OYX09389.1 MAG: hypothetical protein B7Z08_05600 [Sphingomonadales bacterium 32-68-7]